MPEPTLDWSKLENASEEVRNELARYERDVDAALSEHRESQEEHIVEMRPSLAEMEVDPEPMDYSPIGAELKTENERLREENENLRKLLRCWRERAQDA